MSLTAAILHAAGDETAAREAEDLVLIDPSEWTPMRWSREQAGAEPPERELERALFHSGNSGCAWAP